MKTFFGFVLGAVISLAVVGVWWLQVPVALVGVVVLGAVCLAWLSAVVVLPWNLLFEAARTRRTLERAKSRGVAVSDAQWSRVLRVERRMKWVTPALHVVSAVLVAAGAWVAQVPWGHAFAGLFLLSTFFRPAVESYRALRGQLAEVAEETTFPHHDVLDLVARLDAQERTLEQRDAAQRLLEERVTEAEARADARLAEQHRRLELIARRFDETIHQLTDNKEIISGLRAFLRLVRETPT